MTEIKIENIGGECPVQATGTIDGEPFYFRARWGTWRLSIGSDFEDDTKGMAVHGRNVVGRPRWSYEEEWGEGPFDAGWMSKGDAIKMIDKGAEKYRKERARSEALLAMEAGATITVGACGTPVITGVEGSPRTLGIRVASIDELLSEGE